VTNASAKARECFRPLRESESICGPPAALPVFRHGLSRLSACSRWHALPRRVADSLFRRWNFLWAVLYNVVGAVLASGVLFALMGVPVPPWVAGLAMSLAAATLVLSSLLLTARRSRAASCPLSRHL